MAVFNGDPEETFLSMIDDLAAAGALPPPPPHIVEALARNAVHMAEQRFIADKIFANAPHGDDSPGGVTFQSDPLQ